MADGLQRLADAQLEQSFVGSLLLDPEATAQIVDRCRPDDLYSQTHRWIYEACLALHEARHKIDIATVADQLDADQHLGEIGGAAKLTELVGQTPSAFHVLTYADRLHKLGTLRRLMRAAQSISKLAYDGAGSELDEVLTRAQRLVDAVQPIASDASVLLWLDSLEAFLEQQWERLGEKDAEDAGGRLRDPMLPWSALERFNPRLRPGTLAIVAGGSGIGKTTFLECCAEHWARQGYRVVFYHLELSHQMMLDRRAARLSGLSLREIEDGAMTDKVDRANELLRHYPGGITYVHCPGWTASRLVANARHLHAKGLCDVAIVDYLQKVTLRYYKGQNKADALGDCAETFKIAGEQMGTAWVVGSQFNRKANEYDRKTGDFIRGSGEPHEKANLVLTLDREICDAERQDEQGHVITAVGERAPEMTVRIDKNTGGPTGDTKLMMNAARFTILDAATETVPLNY